MRSFVVPACAVLSLALAGSATLPSAIASVSAAPDPFMLRVLGKTPALHKASACFARVYDPGHLAQHPKQKVAAMLLLVSGEPDAETKAINYSFELGVKFRNRGTQFVSQGFCNHAEEQAGKDGGSGKIGCGVDCDGGGFSAALSEGDKSVMLSLDERILLWKKGQDSEDARDSLQTGEDDKSFLLERTSLADCVPLADKTEAAALKRGY